MSKKLIRFERGALNIYPEKAHLEGGTGRIYDKIYHYNYYDIEDLKNLMSIIKAAIKQQRFNIE